MGLCGDSSIGRRAPAPPNLSRPHVGQAEAPRRSAVHDKHLARDERRFRSGEKRHRGGDLFGTRDPSEWMATPRLVEQRLDVAIRTGSANDARSTAVSTYPGATALTRMPSRAWSAASARANATIPDFATVYATRS